MPNQLNQNQHQPTPPPPKVFNGNGILEKSGSPDNIINAPACFDTPLYAQLGCSCWGRAMAACPATAHWFCRSCTKDWKRPRGSAGVEYVPVGWLVNLVF
jgi:hypothetical protein